MIWNSKNNPPKEYKEVLGQTANGEVYLVDFKSDGDFHDTKIFMTKREIVSWCEITKDSDYCTPDNIDSKEEHEEYLKTIGHEKHVKMLQHHYDTTVGLYAIDFDPKELLERFSNSQSDAHSIECVEYENLLEDWNKWIDNKNIKECPFFQLK
jgi:hypothetical protein